MTRQVVDILQNRSHRYSNHNSNIKYVDLIIKCINFESIHYFININVVSSFIIFMILILFFYQSCIISLSQ